MPIFRRMGLNRPGRLSFSNKGNHNASVVNRVFQSQLQSIKCQFRADMPQYFVFQCFYNAELYTLNPIVVHLVELKF
jgi:hypothetical protein